MVEVKKGKLLIDPEEVDKAFNQCFYTEKEITSFVDGKLPEDAVIVEGIVNKFAFHPRRLEAQRGKVAGWLKLLPNKFKKNGGGGCSFLQACVQEDGRQWTGLHLRMEQLFCLGMGLDLVQCQIPRKMWPMFPGGMPYYVIDIE